MEGAVSDTEEGSELSVVGILSIALQKSEGGHKIALLKEVVSIWQSKFLLLL